MRFVETAFIVWAAWYLYTHRDTIKVNWPELLAYSVVGLSLARLVR